MAFTDIFIKRPVLALVVSLLILLIGFKAATSLPIRQYPDRSGSVRILQLFISSAPLPQAKQASS